jgi:uncharacterized protein (DUF1786 family)
MDVFTLDVGSGTQDFLLYTDKNIRNCLKMILPSPTRIIASKIRKIEGDVYLHGYTMGGGAITFAVKEHLRRGYRVFADERAALTFSDNIERVKEMGVIIGNCENATRIETKDVDLEFFSQVIKRVGYEMPDTFAIAVQDHGYAPLESNRAFRFKMFRKLIERDANLTGFLFHSREIPQQFNRMRDAALSIEDRVEADVYVVDTVFAAIAGCAFDTEFPALLLNFGNSHVTGAVVDKDWRILSIFEHHTGVLRRKGREYINDFVRRFLKGEVDNEYVLEDGGHGCYIGEVVDVRDIACTGPQIELSNFREARVVDPMITGNLGMLAMLSERGVISPGAFEIL